MLTHRMPTMELEIALAVPIRKRPSMSCIPLDIEEGVFYAGTHMENIRRSSDTTEIRGPPPRSPFPNTGRVVLDDSRF